MTTLGPATVNRKNLVLPGDKKRKLPGHRKRKKQFNVSLFEGGRSGFKSDAWNNQALTGFRENPMKRRMYLWYHDVANKGRASGTAPDSRALTDGALMKSSTNTRRAAACTRRKLQHVPRSLQNAGAELTACRACALKSKDVYRRRTRYAHTLMLIVAHSGVSLGQVVVNSADPVNLSTSSS